MDDTIIAEYMFAAGLSLGMKLADETINNYKLDRNLITVSNEDANKIKDTYGISYLAVMKYCEENNISLRQHFSVALNQEYISNKDNIPKSKFDVNREVLNRIDQLEQKMFDGFEDIREDISSVDYEVRNR